MVESRAREYGGIYARYGASVKISNVISGPNTGCIDLLRGYADFRTASKAFREISSDPAYAEFAREREANPVADVIMMRNLARRIFGEGSWDTHPISYVRQYGLARDKLPEALGLLAEIEKISVKADTNVVALVPVTGDEMSSMSVSYQFRSMDHCGEAFDTVGTSEEFQAIVAKASAIRTLRSAFMMAPV